MPLIVQKFGGSSVADTDKIRRCAQRAYDTRRAGNDVIVIVSAMGKTTDKLIELAEEISTTPPNRELDQLLSAGEQVSIALTAMALESLGQPAVSLTGPQTGFLTDSSHTKAKIRSIERERIEKYLAEGKVVVVAGFQGVTDEGQTTTLGRGGSDTSAVAIAAALGAECCEIYTDVDGVCTADPRLVPNARKLERIGYDEMFELAGLGAKVMAPRAIFLGMKFNVPIHVRHALLPDTGTMIVPETPEMEEDQVTSVALKSNIGRVTMTDVPTGPGVEARLFGAIAQAGIMVDDIIQNEIDHERTNISFTLDHNDLPDIKPVLDKVLVDLGRGQVRIDVGLCRVSAVGAGMRTQSGVAARMFGAFAEAPGGGINIQNITTSEIKIGCILAKEDGQRALQAVHDAFNLGESPG